MIYHPHIHVIMPGVSLAQDGLRIHRGSKAGYLLPCDQAAQLFRNTLDRLILERDTKERSRDHTQIDPQVWHMDWIVDIQHVGRGKQAIRYLARYVCKTAVTDKRLLGKDEQGRIRLNCQDSDSGKWYEIALSPHEFVRRWSLHVLPKGLRRIRQYGWLAPAAKRRYERVCQILRHKAPSAPRPVAKRKALCPTCRIEMPVVQIVRRAWRNQADLAHQKAQSQERQARGEKLIIIKGPQRAPPAGMEAG
jgi:hypothetical protein